MRQMAIALVLLLTACGAPGGSSSPASPGVPAGTWQLTAGMSGGAELPVPHDHPITLTLEPSSMGGIATCNHYGAEFRLTDGGIQLGAIEQTLRGCPAELEAAERAYVAALSKVSRIGIDGDALFLTGPDIELRFHRLPDPPTADLVDVTWVLETLIVGEAATQAAGEPAILELRSDGSFTGSTGCRTFHGTWVENGNQIHPTAMDMSDAACPAELTDQDGQVGSVIGDGFVSTIDRDHLTLMDPGRIGLVYRSEK